MGTKQLHLTTRFTSAVDYARHIHIERRKGTDIPYMAHLLGVASLVMGETGHAGFPVTEDMVIAALLHDAAEDHGGLQRLLDIEENFGPNVARMVEGLSDSLSEDSSNKQAWSERKQTISKDFAKSQLTSGSSQLPTSSITQEQFWKTIGKSGHRYGNDSSVGGQSRSGIFDELLAVYKSTGMGRLVEELQSVVDDLRQMSTATRERSTGLLFASRGSPASRRRLVFPDES
jgi:hypothetical protein